MAQEFDRKLFAEQIVMYRAAQRISQAEMARRCGVTLQTIYHLENCIQKPTKLTVAKIRMVMEEKEAEE